MIDSPEDFRIIKKEFEEIIGFPLISPRERHFRLGTIRISAELKFTPMYLL